MQMVKKILIMLGLVWLGFFVLMPKQELYYKLEEVLEKQSIVMNEKQKDEGLFSLTLHQVDVYVKGIKLATIEKVDFFTLLFYSSVTCEDVMLDDSLKAMAPTQITTAKATHAIWAPLKINLNAQGPFGSVEGSMHLNDRSVRLDFNESKGIEMLKSSLKQDEKGWYYETSF